MKNYIFFFIIVLFGGLYSCQKEDNNQNTTTQNLTKASTLTSLASRVCQYPTYKDNVIDGTSTFAVLLPVTVTVNATIVTLLDSNHYQTIKDIKNEYSTDDDVIHFSFPIRLKYKNYQEVSVNTQEQFDSIFASSSSDDDFNEIECIDFNFPIVINTYNSVTQTPNTITITSNSQFYNFIGSLNGEDIYTMVYPLSMTNSNGETTVYNSNTELQAGIENVIDDCNDDGSGNTSLSDIIVNGTWRISSFIDEGEDETDHFNGYNFTFLSNGNAVTVKNTITINGSWSSYIDDGYSKLDLSFDGDTLEELEDDWRIIEYSPMQIKLRHVSGGDGSTHYLTFTKN
jgi:hypothetical protein